MRILLLSMLMLLGACQSPVGREVARHGDEIVVAGRHFRTGASVVLWSDPQGFDAYRPWLHFAPRDDDRVLSPRFGIRNASEADDHTFRRRRAGQWTLEELGEVVDQIVVHYDACGSSATCFRVLHDERGLSAHFLVDVDGTIYQTLDVEERAWHATIANDRSIGIEIAHRGAFPIDETKPAPTGTVTGTIHDVRLRQSPFTDAQEIALAHLVATLCEVLPRLDCVVPTDERGAVLARTLEPHEFEAFRGVLGHFHVQRNKVDPGPAFDWERIIETARRLRR